MTIGQMILQHRQATGLSQDALAEKLSVSRQSVAKWETDRSLPKTDKLLPLCEVLGITTQTLLSAHMPPRSFAVKEKKAGRYFGTDGFRGEANVTLTSMQAYKVGRFLGWYYASPLCGCRQANYRPRIAIGKDTRRSSYMLEYSLVAGITASGADAYMLHVITTPGVSYVTRQDAFDCGIMITASHNPFADNGIKVINSFGEKLDDRTTALIEQYLDGDMRGLGIEGDDLPLAQREKIGCIVDHAAGRHRYVGYLISLASHSYKDLRIGLDCANGASWMIAKTVFDALGAKTVAIGAEPDGLNVNRDCGSTHPTRLCALVKEQHLHMGFAFDGDADRCIAVDENGCIIDGDAILYIFARRLKSRGMLGADTVVATVMSNSGLDISLAQSGISCARANVGDRFVYELMQEKDLSLGGEQSGHIIMRKYATTGDGILTALMLTEEMCERKMSLAKLTDGLFLFPQHLVNLRAKDKEAVLSDAEVLRELADVEACIGGEGRALLRVSGTEPKVRIMVEAPTEPLCRTYAERVANVIRKRGYVIED